MTFNQFFEKFYNGWMVNSINVCLMDQEILKTHKLERANVGAFILMIVYMESLGKFLADRGDDPLKTYLMRCMGYNVTEAVAIDKARNNTVHHYNGGEYCQIVENSSMHRTFRKDRIMIDINRFAGEFKKITFCIVLNPK